MVSPEDAPAFRVLYIAPTDYPPYVPDLVRNMGVELDLWSGQEEGPTKQQSQEDEQRWRSANMLVVSSELPSMVIRHWLDRGLNPHYLWGRVILEPDQIRELLDPVIAVRTISIGGLRQAIRLSQARGKQIKDS